MEQNIIIKMWLRQISAGQLNHADRCHIQWNVAICKMIGVVQWNNQTYLNCFKRLSIDSMYYEKFRLKKKSFISYNFYDQIGAWI